MDEPQRTRPDATTVAISVLGLIAVGLSFAVVLTQENTTARISAIVTTVVIWVALRFWRRSRA